MPALASPPPRACAAGPTSPCRPLRPGLRCVHRRPWPRLPSTHAWPGRRRRCRSWSAVDVPSSATGRRREGAARSRGPPEALGRRRRRCCRQTGRARCSRGGEQVLPVDGEGEVLAGRRIRQGYLRYFILSMTF
ncbi:hypothetical protein BS78_08G000400 [Paspalum vaginatum]|nr:hypothetical protein BS78_08G000400 [Paspalum vaginatum]